MQGITDRMAKLDIELSKRYSMQIIQIYAPTIEYPDEEIEELYGSISRNLGDSKNYFKIVMGDFNAKVGTKLAEEKTVGEHGYGPRNDRGSRMVGFTEKENFFIMDTFFKKKSARKWTWRSPNNNTSKRDYILSNNRNIFKDCDIVNRFNIGSDHHLVRAKIHIDVKKERKLMTNQMQNIDTEQLKLKKQEFQILLSNKFQALYVSELTPTDIDHTNKAISEYILEGAKTIGREKRTSHRRVINENISNLMKKRGDMKINDNYRNKIEYIELCKTIRKQIREEIRKRNCDQIREIIKKNKNIKGAIQGTNKSKRILTSLRKQDGTLTNNQKEIMNCINISYSQLYADDLEDLPTPDKEDDEIPEILIREVKNAIRNSKPGKAAGPDGITNDILKSCGAETYKILTDLFNLCIKQKKIPECWKNAKMMLLHKKGDQTDLKNYRPINILSSLYKIFTSIITKRLENQLDSEQPQEQAGFRKNYNTIDHIFALKQTIERSNEYELPLCLAFIDYEKAFDSSKHKAIFEALQVQGVSKHYIEIIKNIYANASATIHNDTDTTEIKILKGVRQGETISPKLFTAGLQEIFK